MTMHPYGLTFNTLRRAQQRRTERTPAYDACADWTHAQWMMALVGEVGELANFLKKVDRGDYELQHVIVDVTKELADIQCYLDLLAAKLKVDLGHATAAKFNEVSLRLGTEIYIKNDLSDFVYDIKRAYK